MVAITAVLRCVASVLLCWMLAAVLTVSAAAEPADPAAFDPPPADGAVPSGEPATISTPDGWILTIGAKDEAHLPVQPLTTAVSSREYLSSGTFVASLAGPEPPQGTLEVGYQIGCGVDMSTASGVTIAGSGGAIPGIGAVIPGDVGPAQVLPAISTPINSVVSVGLKPGFVLVVPVDRKEFKGGHPWVMINNFRIKIDGCVGQSFIRSYAVLTRVTDESDVVLSYAGVTKAV